MSNDYIIFNTEAEALSAVDTCWIQYLKDKVTAGYTAVSDNGQEYTNLSTLTDEEICQLKLYGKFCNGTNNKTCGLLDCYQTYMKAYEQNKWFLPAPAIEYLVLLTGYTVMTGQQIVDAGYYGPEV